MLTPISHRSRGGRFGILIRHVHQMWDAREAKVVSIALHEVCELGGRALGGMWVNVGGDAGPCWRLGFHQPCIGPLGDRRRGALTTRVGSLEA